MPAVSPCVRKVEGTPSKRWDLNAEVLQEDIYPCTDVKSELNQAGNGGAGKTHQPPRSQMRLGREYR